MLLDNFFCDFVLRVDELGFESFKDSVEDDAEVDVILRHVA